MTPVHPKEASALDQTALHPGDGTGDPTSPAACLPPPISPFPRRLHLRPSPASGKRAPGGPEVPLANWRSSSCLRRGQVLSRPHTWFSLRLQTPLAAGQARLTRDPALPGVQKQPAAAGGARMHGRAAGI